MVLLAEFLHDIGDFTPGLGISYLANLLNDVQNSYPPLSIVPGHRAPDVAVYKPHNTKHQVRLYELTKYNGKFQVVIFAGRQPDTATSLKTLRADFDRTALLYKDVVNFLTIVAGVALSFDEYLPVSAFGKAYWDIDQSAYAAYGVGVMVGAIVVLRPDGILGCVGSLDDFASVTKYFDRLVIGKDIALVEQHTANADRKEEFGSFMGLNEDHLVLPPEHESVEEGVVLLTMRG